MRIITLTENEFNNFSQNNEFTSHCQSSAYANIEKKMEKYNIHYLGFEEDCNLIGAAMMLYKETILGYKYAYSPRGFLINYADFNIVSNVTKGLVNLLKKQKFIFVKINPPVVNKEVSFNNEIISQNDKINDLIHLLKKLNYQPSKKAILPNSYVIANLIQDNDQLFASFSKDNQIKIEQGREKSLIIRLNPEDGLERYERMVKDKASPKTINYYKDLYSELSINKECDLFILHIDTNHYGTNINNIYSKEHEKNLSLKKIIESADHDRYNIDEVIEDKITSDRIIANLEQEIRKTTNFIKKYPNGIDIGISMIVKKNSGTEVITNYFNPEFQSLNAEPFFYFEIMKYYAAQGYHYINLGAVNLKNNRYQNNKEGFNSSIYNYIGEYDLVINPLLYKIYLKKENK